MPTMFLDDREVEVEAGTTILAAAKKLGVDIPTLCFLEGLEPETSCMVCMVKVLDPPRLVPACGTPVSDGMRVETRTEEVRHARKVALELLLGDHAGDCMAPCQSICPAHMDVPTMIRQIAAGEFQKAIVTAKSHIALPGILGHICTKPCEKGCRRAGHDGSVSVCLLKQNVAEVDLASESPWLPEVKPSTGRRVAVVGAGPAGLAAAYYLLQEGHATTIFDDHPEPGGMLRYAVEEERLPRSVLEGEIDAIRRLGGEFRMGTRVGDQVPFEELRQSFDAVFIAAGELDAAGVARLGVPGTAQGVRVDRKTFGTEMEGVFAGGGAVRKSRLAVRSVAEGRMAAISMARFLAGEPLTPLVEPFNNRLQLVAPVEVTRMTEHASVDRRTDPQAGPVTGFSLEEARREAARCLGCDCRKLADCKLRLYAEEYGADPNRFRGERRQIEFQLQQGGVVFESGKCISCGICVQLTARAKEPLGLTFIGRGFNVRIGVPFNRTVEEGLQKVAEECIAACPTGALAFAERLVKDRPESLISCNACGVTRAW